MVTNTALTVSPNAHPLERSQAKPAWTRPLSMGVLIVEAAIATIVFSIFATTPPKTISTQPTPAAIAQTAAGQGVFPVN
jgi:hypothetical protein